MLTDFFKFHFVNNTGVQLDFQNNSVNEKIDLDYKKWKFDSNGALSFDVVTNLAYTATDVANGNSAEFAADDNSTDKNLGLHGVLTVQTDNPSADGTVDLYLDWSYDGGTTYASDAADFNPEEDLIWVASARIVGDGAGYVRAVNFEV